MQKLNSISIEFNVLNFCKVDPIRDLDIINEELRLKVHIHLRQTINMTFFTIKDVEYFEKIFDECERMYVRGAKSEVKESELSGVEVY